MFLFNRIFQFHPQVLHKVVLKECILKPQGGGGRGGEGGYPYLTDAGDAWVMSRDRETTFTKLK